MTAVLNGSPAQSLLERGEQAWAMHEQVRRVGGCERPIRLRGRADLVEVVTGEVRRSWSSEELPDGTILLACGNRRATVCGPCSRLYQGDAFQLVVSGLRGGKTVPDTITSHPALFVTLTAPSFGPVHTSRLDRYGDLAPCHGRRGAGTCDHGLSRACWERHEPDDPQLGQPLCAECFDYEAAVLWNAHCSELWRRTRIDLYRQLAKLTGRTERQVKADVSVQYVKVAEFQRRGLLHFHLALRLDGTTRTQDDEGREAHAFAPPPAGYTAELLAAAVRAAVAHVEAPYPQPSASTTTPAPSADEVPAPTLFGEAGQGLACEAGRGATLDARPSVEALASGPGRVRYPADALPVPEDALSSGLLPTLRLHVREGLRAARWGEQVAIEPIPIGDLAEGWQGMERGQVAGYLAKYATKHTEALGGLDRRVTLDDVPLLLVNPHIRRLVATALLLRHLYPSPEHGRDLMLARWAHQLGYGGHWLTKSRSWSTTFTALRQARREWQSARNPDAIDVGDGEARIASWRMVGVGYRLPGDAWLAEIARRRAEEARELEREQRAEAAAA